MKYIIYWVLFIFLVAFAWILPVAGNSPGGIKETAQNTTPTTEELAKRYPVAPGVWYPTDGPIPEKPVRYYRVRCWPGCHSGSTNGKYPNRALGMKPIFPTSAASAHPVVPGVKE